MVKKENKGTTLVSVIIPAFRQEKTIVRNILRIEKVLNQLRYASEIIIVADGMEDKTYEKAKKLESDHIKVFGYQYNRGKGYAIRYGMVRSKGNVVAFIDSGIDLNPNGLSMLLEHFEWYDADIIIGSKRHPVSKVKYPLDRKILSFFSQLYIRLLFGLNIRDTQVGMKFFRRKVVEDVLPRLLVKKFAFDIEILVVAYHLGYRKIFEAPIEIAHSFKESIISQNLFSVVIKTFLDTLGIFYRLKILRYYDNASRKKWIPDPELTGNIKRLWK